MNQKADAMRASDRSDGAIVPMKSLGSNNEYSIATPNQTQTQEWNTAERRAIGTRFHAKVKKTDCCWLWTGSVTGGGGVKHGAFRLHGRPAYAHRIAWELEYGVIPAGLQVNHKCDVPLCVRPGHLFLGSQFDNLADARQKGRLNNTRPRTRKLTLADRLVIYHTPERRGVCVELAVRFHVSKTCISVIRRGRFVRAPRVVVPLAPSCGCAVAS